jgi:hypothetical protein
MALLQLLSLSRLCLPVQTGFILCDAPVDLPGCTLAGIAILFLKQSGEDVELAGSSIQIVIGESAPPGLGFAANLFPLAFDNILVHGMFLYHLEKLSQFASVRPSGMLGAAD